MSTSTGTNRVNRLVIAIREEVASHEKIVELLTVQEGSIRNPAGEAFQAATLELEVELKRSAGRTARRERALAELAAELGVAPGVATIGSMVERLGADGEDLYEADTEDQPGQDHQEQADDDGLVEQWTQSLEEPVLDLGQTLHVVA